MQAVNFKDLTGQVFGSLTVVSRAENLVYKGGKIKVRWNCLCECGNKTVKYSNQLKVADKPVSCGCMTPKAKSKYDINGGVFGFLTVLEKSQKKVGRNYLWSCKCECGNIISVLSTVLRKGEKKSCGCKTKAETSGTHGMYGTPTHNTWRTMIERCTRPYHKSYEKYKTVSICSRWMESFENFYEDMGERPEGTTLDRLDNNMGYSKENCRWATGTQQQQNKKPNYINKNKGLAGVATSGNKFAARIRYNGKREYLGSFETPEEANAAYNKRGFEIFGDEWIYKGSKNEE